MRSVSTDGRWLSIRTENTKGFNERHFDSIYVADRLRRIGAKSVIEIGGGSGYVAHYAMRMGIDRYTIVDLPSVAMVQYIILGCSLGSDQVGLRSKAPISIFPSTHLGAIDWDVDCVVNVDSIPEMPKATGSDYVRRATAAKLFLSINQESAIEIGEAPLLVVRDLCDGRFHSLARHPYWMRTGWVEEVYAPR